MSHFATPFIVINLGCEMIYVIDQRLCTQKIPLDKSEKVLTDIVSVLLHPKLLDELFIPQPVATHAVIKQLLQDISATSIMKLDDYSMSKLWDLMTMIFKWQLSVTTNQNIFDISRRHIRSVATTMPEYFTKTIFENALRKFETLAKKFTDDDYNCLCNTLILWFSEYHTKISILIRLGLQNRDGTFCLPSTINSKVLQKLGENIYKYDTNKKTDEEPDTSNEMNEISCLLGPIDIGFSLSNNVIELQLPIDLEKKELNKKVVKLNKDTNYENITPLIRNRNSDLSFPTNVPKSLQEHLLDMMQDS